MERSSTTKVTTERTVVIDVTLGDVRRWLLEQGQRVPEYATYEACSAFSDDETILSVSWTETAQTLSSTP